MTTTQEDAIEILSYPAENFEDDNTANNIMMSSIKLVEIDPTQKDDPSDLHRRRVVRAVGAVTLLLLLFSILLIGISLNMSKEIDELVRQSTLTMKSQHTNYITRKENTTRPV